MVQPHRKRSPWRSTLAAGLIGAGAATAGFVFWLSFPQPMRMNLPAPGSLTATEVAKKVPRESPLIEPPAPRRSVRARAVVKTAASKRKAAKPESDVMQPRARFIPESPRPDIQPRARFIPESPAPYKRQQPQTRLVSSEDSQ